MVTVSPPVSPSVVARILMSQKPSVTSGTYGVVLHGVRHSRSLLGSMEA
jgi:hypothetical protein